MAKPPTTRTADLVWDREEDEEWADTVHVRLVLDHDAPAGLAAEVLAEAHQLVHEAGLPAQEVLGEPEAYARTVAAERISEAHRAKVDPRGLTPGERVCACLGTLGFIGFMLGLVQWVEDGLWVTASWASAAGYATVGAVVLVGTLAFVARAAGHIRGMWGFLAGTACVFAGGIAVATNAPGEPLFDVPVPVLMAACVAWTVGAYAFPQATLDRWFAPRPHADDEQWLARLEGLLRGRHAMPAAEARGHVREAGEHLAGAGGGHAEDVFGDVEVYALRLAEGPRKRRRVARHKMYRAAAVAAMFAVLAVVEVVEAGRFTGWVACYVGASGAWLWTLVAEWRESRRPAGTQPPR
ncbi:hypothetical protein JQK87_30195 [Streptomyces sp. G44]|uniref:hypothetical protein n=1 Tax=Streptomyces sp. G44 TaxID=2807632 RepID=UPI001961D74A|nr:hypothetical protein [Streptomyces sp. G44]MBM7172590.1 hypothetical protein [Streptomyces sp. G44]